MNTLLRLAPVLAQLGEVMRNRVHRFFRRAVWFTVLAGLAFFAGFFATALGLWALYLVLLAEMSAPAAAGLISLGLFAVSGLFVALMVRMLSGPAHSKTVKSETIRPPDTTFDNEATSHSSVLGALAIGVVTGFLSGRKGD